MKHKHFVVNFKNGKTVFVSCFNHTEAKILSQAIMIKKCLSYEIKSIRLATGLDEMEKTDFVA